MSEEECIKYLEDRGYAVVKLSKTNLEDIEECVLLDSQDSAKDCSTCSCSVCLMKYY